MDIPIFALVTGIWEALTPGSEWVDAMELGLAILLLTDVGIELLGFILKENLPLEGTTS